MAAGKLGKKMLMIWEFFTVAEDSKFAICDTCEVKVLRGGATIKLFTTTNLVYHLTMKHPELHTKYIERKANQEQKQLKETRKRSLECQLSLTEVQNLAKAWDISDHRVQQIHHKIGKMLAIDS